MSVAAGSRSKCGSSFAIPSTVCPAVPSLTIRSFACTEDSPQNLVKWNRSPISLVLAMFPIPDCCVISFGRILILALQYVVLCFDCYCCWHLRRLCGHVLPFSIVPVYIHHPSLLLTTAGLGREWPRSLLYLWRRCRPSIPSPTRFRSGGTSSSSRRGRVWIFCGPWIGDGLFGTQLLWRVWQCRSYDDSRRYPHVLVSNSETGQCRTAKRRWWIPDNGPLKAISYLCEKDRNLNDCYWHTGIECLGEG